MTDRLLASESFSGSLHSEVLVNDLDQLAHLPSNVVLSAANADLLSRPISARKAQLAARGGPIEFLQRKAQYALASSATVAIAGPVTSYLAWMSHYVTSASATAISVTAVAAAAWLLQRNWAKAQRRFVSPSSAAMSLPLRSPSFWAGYGSMLDVLG